MSVLSVIVVAVLAQIGPLLVIIVQGQQRRTDKAQDWKRQDDVAKEVKAAASQAAEATSLLVAADKERAEHATSTEHKINEMAIVVDKVHDLTNSAYTERQIAELDARELGLISLEKLAALTGDPTPDELGRIAHEKKVIVDLKESIKIRLRQTKAEDLSR